MARILDALLGFDEWPAFADPWDKVDEPCDGPDGATCVDCALCTEVEGDDASYALKPGARIGWCSEAECFVTDEGTVEEKQLECFERRW